jgi:hypothetical protein
VLSSFASQKLRPFVATRSRADLLVLKELTEAGEGHIGHRPDVPAARDPRGDPHFGEEHAQAKVVITV